ncbi:MAG: 2'-5' RNA ligase family protein [Thermoflavifilum sp.]|nr:2'-5' RNA ligase family protein [Thermoflavifilum sp.]
MKNSTHQHLSSKNREPLPRGLIEYLLAAPIHGRLLECIQAERVAFSQQFGQLTTTSEILVWLIHFWQWKTEEKKLIPQIRQVVASLHPVLLEVNGFGFMPTHSIYIKIVNQSNIAEIVKAFRPIQAQLKSSWAKPHLITEPYFLFASRLKPWQYEQSFPVYQQQSLTGRCMVNQLSLWSKTSTQNSFTPIASFPMLGNNVVKQPTLFG